MKIVACCIDVYMPSYVKVMISLKVAQPLFCMLSLHTDQALPS